MYYFFAPDLVYWRNDLVQALLESHISQENQNEWWYGKSLKDSTQFRFSIRKNAPVLDNYLVNNIFDLYSESLIKILGASGARYEVFPAEFISRSDKKAIALSHKVFRLTEISDCLNEGESEFETVSFGKRQVNTLIRPVFTEEFLHSSKMLTRIKGFEKYVVIHSELKKIIEDNNITGCDFYLSNPNLSDTPFA